MKIMWKGYSRSCSPSLSTPTRFRRGLLALFILGLVSFLFVENSLGEYPLMTMTLDELYDPPSTSIMPNNTTILLVSALFPLEKSKHSHSEYAEWLSEFLKPITTDIYFFTSAEFEPVVRKARGPRLPITIDTTYSSPFEIPPLKDLEKKYEEMHSFDREKSYHSPGLYAIWGAKPFFLDAGVKNAAKHGKVYEYAFWNDAGSFRGKHKYKDWPDTRRVDQVWRKGQEMTGRRKEDLLFFALTGMYDEDVKTWTEDRGPVDHDISEGSFFGGSPSTVSWWAQTYYAYHDYYLKLGYFVGKDQTLINAILLLHPERVITMFYFDGLAPAREGRGQGGELDYCEVGYLGACGSQWYYYQFWLSGRGTREDMRDLWVDEAASEWKDWRRRRTCKARERCRLTRLLPLKDVLEEKFGEGWTPPRRTLVRMGDDTQ